MSVGGKERLDKIGEKSRKYPETFFPKLFIFPPLEIYFSPSPYSCAAEKISDDSKRQHKWRKAIFCIFSQYKVSNLSSFLRQLLLAENEINQLRIYCFALIFFFSLRFQVGLRQPPAQLHVLPRASRSPCRLLPVHRDAGGGLRPLATFQRLGSTFLRGKQEDYCLLHLFQNCN